MKDRLLIILTAVAVLFMVGCENSLERSIAFDVTPQVESGSVTGSTISVPAGTPVTFNFTGDLILSLSSVENPVANTAKKICLRCRPMKSLLC